MADLITITIDEEALDDLRTAALERMWAENADAEALGRKKLKRMAADAARRAQRFSYAVKMLDYALKGDLSISFKAEASNA